MGLGREMARTGKNKEGAGRIHRLSDPGAITDISELALGGIPSHHGRCEPSPLYR